MKIFFILLFAAWNCAAFDLSNPAFVGSSGRSSAAAVETFPVDLFSNFKGDDGATVTTNLLAASSQSVYGIGTWSLSQEFGATHVIDGTGTALVSPVSVRGTNQSASTNWVKVNCDKSTNFAAVTFNGEVSAVSIAVNFYFESFAPFLLQDLITVANGSQYSIFNFYSDAVCGHSPNGGSGKTPYFTLESNTVYLATMKARSSGVCQYAIYDASGNLLWSDSLTNNNATGFNRVALGRFDRIAQATTGNFYYANLRVDFHDAVFPLGVNYNATNYPSIPTLEVSDDFAGTGALSGDWTLEGTGIARVSGEAQSTSGNDSTAIWTGDTFNKNQVSKYTLKSWGAPYMGIAVRAHNSGGLNCYFYNANSGVANGIAKFVNGSYSSLQAVAAAGWQVGDLMELRAQGQLVTLWRNGALVQHVLDSTHSSGSPGFSFYANGGTAAADDWEGGNLP